MNTASEKTVEIARSLVVGFLIEQVRGRARFLLSVASFVFVASVMLVAILDGAPRLLAMLSALLGAAIIATVWLLRAVTVRLLGRFAEPVAATAHQEAIDRALSDLDVPSGPVSAARFAWRLRKGTGVEIDRVTEVVASLRHELEAP